jgi:hypothetical protein
MLAGGHGLARMLEQKPNIDDARALPSKSVDKQLETRALAAARG